MKSLDRSLLQLRRMNQSMLTPVTVWTSFPGSSRLSPPNQPDEPRLKGELRPAAKGEKNSSIDWCLPILSRLKKHTIHSFLSFRIQGNCRDLLQFQRLIIQ